MYEYIQLPNPKLTFRHMVEAARIVDNALGTGYFQEHLSEIECCWIVLSEDAVVGYAAVATERHPTAPSVGCLKCVAVDPLYRGQGIGTMLTELRMEYLDGYPLIFADAWVRPSGYCDSCKTLERFGFTVYEETEGFYADRKHKCPSCKDVCQCVARRYVKTNQR